MVASYDDQDRLLTYGDTVYSYNASGDLSPRQRAIRLLLMPMTTSETSFTPAYLAAASSTSWLTAAIAESARRSTVNLSKDYCIGTSFGLQRNSMTMASYAVVSSTLAALMCQIIC